MNRTFGPTIRANPPDDCSMGEERSTIKVVEKAGQWGFFFLLAYVGAAIYFISRSGGAFWDVILGLLQAAVWPVYLTFHALEALGV